MSTTRNGGKKPVDETAGKNLVDETSDIDMTTPEDSTAEYGAMAAQKSSTGTGTPNATKGEKTQRKPKYPCGKCDLGVTCGVSCNSCEVWFHDKCVEGMSKEYFDNCKKTYEIFRFTSFLCKICRKVFTALNKSLKEMKGGLKAMEDRVMVLELEKQALAQKVERMEKGAEKVTERVDGVEKEVATGMIKAKEEVKQDVRTEMLQRDENSSNIVIYGLKESKEVNSVKWREGETKKVTDLVQQINVRVEGEIAVKRRAGMEREEGAKPRPLIVRVTDDETRERIFRNARLLAHEERTKKVFISQDLTRQQREDDRKAEVEMKAEAVRRTEEAVKAGRKVKFVVVGARGRRRVVPKLVEEQQQQEETAAA